MKKHLLLYLRSNPSLLTAVAFGLASLPLMLIENSGGTIPAILVSGAVGGTCLAYLTRHRDLTVLAMFGFGSAFLIGGMIAGGGLILLVETSLTFFGFYTMYVLGFGIAGLLSAAFTRSRLVTLTNSTISFLIGGIVGGAVIGVLSELAGRKATLTSAMGVLITTAVGGALAGAVSEPPGAEEGAKSNNVTQG